MAVIRQFIPGQQTVRRHPTEVDCYWQLIGGASPLLHLSTFGSEDRASGPKSSQSLQLDEVGAGELMRLLETAFPALRRHG
jgi:hypothetical protein